MDTLAPPSAKELRQFGLLLGAVVSVIFGIALPWLANRAFPLWPWFIAGALWLPAIVSPVLLRPVFRVWMKAAAALNWVVTRIVLAFVYYFLVTPMGLVMRLRGRDPMNRTWDKAANSYRKYSDPNERNDMERPF